MQKVLKKVDFSLFLFKCHRYKTAKFYSQNLAFVIGHVNVCVCVCVCDFLVTLLVTVCVCVL